MSVEKRPRCPSCGKPTGYLMETHHDAPGLLGLLRGEGDGGLLTHIAWLAVVLCAVAVGFALAAII